MGTQCAVHLEEALHLVDDAIKVTGLVPGGGLVGVAVHRIALPDHLVSGGLNLLDDRRQQIAHLVVAQPGDQRQPTRLVLRVKTFDVFDSQFRRHRRPDLHPDRVRDHLREGDMSAVELTCALPDPDVMRRQVIEAGLTKLLGEPQHGPLVVQHQSLMAGVDLGGVEVAVVDPAGRHEAHAAVDLARQCLIPGPGRRGANELPVPVVRQVQRRQTRGGECPDQIHRGTGVGVGAHQPGRVVLADGRVGGEPVDHVAAIGSQTQRVDV